MDVIRFALSEDDVKAIGQDVLNSLANCSTSLVMMEVRRYLSSPNADEEVKNMVRTAFSEELTEIASESDDELLMAISTISDLRYTEICGSATLEDLNRWMSCIDTIKAKGELRPYKSAVKLYTIRDIVEHIKDMGLDPIAKKIIARKNVFSEVNTARAVGTPFKHAYFKSTQTEIKERGIDFLIRMKKSGTTPNRWRFL